MIEYLWWLNRWIPMIVGYHFWSNDWIPSTFSTPRTVPSPHIVSSSFSCISGWWCFHPKNAGRLGSSQSQTGTINIFEIHNLNKLVMIKLGGMKSIYNYWELPMSEQVSMDSSSVQILQFLRAEVTGSRWLLQQLSDVQSLGSFRITESILAGPPSIRSARKLPESPCWGMLIIGSMITLNAATLLPHVEAIGASMLEKLTIWPLNLPFLRGWFWINLAK